MAGIEEDLLDKIEAEAGGDVRGLASSKSNRGARRAVWSGRRTFFVRHGVVLHVCRHAAGDRRCEGALLPKTSSVAVSARDPQLSAEGNVTKFAPV